MVWYVCHDCGYSWTTSTHDGHQCPACDSKNSEMNWDEENDNVLDGEDD